ncbi:MAG: GMC oxidoreductase [Myxococcota bacterium]
MTTPRYDWIIIGSGFGGSVSALRLVEKGYNVLLLEKGRRWQPRDFPKTNWDVPRWLWNPWLGLKGFFQMTFLRHVTVLHGVGVGGGSLVYANTLPRPTDAFFGAPSWGPLADWKQELEPHYQMASRMLGAATNPKWTRGDEILGEIAAEMGRQDRHQATEVAIYFGEPGREAEDPYFDGEGPPRTGCTYCGACMTGCRVGAKNTLDKNYLYLAEKRGLELRAETEVTAVRPLRDGGYQVETRPSLGGGSAEVLEAERVIFAGGVLGTIPLLLRLKEDPKGLPGLSARVGDFVRTNSEALFGAVTPNSRQEDFSRGVAITSILHTDEHSHIEPVRYGKGSGFFRLLALPHAPGSNVVVRLARTVLGFLRHPLLWMQAFLVRDFAKQSQILLYMRSLEGSLSLRLGRDWRRFFFRGAGTVLPKDQKPPQTFMPEASAILERFSEKVGGVPMSILTETLLGVPTTAHILGGACMGKDAAEGVIDHQHRVHGYAGLYVIDGSAMSANPGVNPSLTITAMAERAMTFIPPREGSTTSTRARVA